VNTLKKRGVSLHSAVYVLSVYALPYDVAFN